MSLPTLYDYAASANCFKVRLLLAQLGIEYRRVAVDIFDGATLTDDYERLNPLRSTPVLELPTGRFTADSPEAESRRRDAYEVLRILDDHLAERRFLVANRYTIADLSVFAY